MITSTNNTRIKQIVAFQSRRHARRKASSFVAEGLRLIREAVDTQTPISELYYTEDFASTPEGTDLIDNVSRLGATLQPVSDPVMHTISDTETPQGVLAVLPMQSLDMPEDPTFVLIIDGITTPGNLGTILRSAAAAGVSFALTTSGTVDIYNPKVVRSAMGAHFRLPLTQWSWEGINTRLQNHAIFLADSTSGAPYYDFDLTQPFALIVSGEAHGPSAEAYQYAHARLKIPMPGKMESLNVAMAASILLFDAVRQRKLIGS